MIEIVVVNPYILAETPKEDWRDRLQWQSWQCHEFTARGVPSSWSVCFAAKKDVVHDAECPNWDQASLSIIQLNWHSAKKNRYPPGNHHASHI